MRIDNHRPTVRRIDGAAAHQASHYNQSTEQFHKFFQ